MNNNKINNFVEYWQNKGDEKSETQSFGRVLLQHTPFAVTAIHKQPKPLRHSRDFVSCCWNFRNV